MAKKKAPKKTPKEKAAPAKAEAAAATPLGRVKANVLTGQPLNPEDVRKVELEYREQTGHHITPSATQMVTEILREELPISDAQRLAYKAAGIVLPKLEGGNDNPVGPQDEYVAQAFGTTRKGDVDPEAAETPVSATDQSLAHEAATKADSARAAKARRKTPEPKALPAKKTRRKK